MKFGKPTLDNGAACAPRHLRRDLADERRPDFGGEPGIDVPGSGIEHQIAVAGNACSPTHRRSRLSSSRRFPGLSDADKIATLGGTAAKLLGISWKELAQAVGAISTRPPRCELREAAAKYIVGKSLRHLNG